MADPRVPPASGRDVAVDSSLLDDEIDGPISVIPPAPSSLSSPPPPPTSDGSPLPPPAYPEPEAMVVALVMAPGMYPRNRFFAMFNVPTLRKARWRAAQLRGLVNALARPSAPIADYVLERHTDHSLLSYRVPSLNARVQAYLRPHEAAVVEVAVARIRGETPPAAAYALVQGWLGRLAPALG